MEVADTAQYQVCCLDARDEREVFALLSEDRGRNVYLLWRLQQGVLSQGSAHEHMLGVRRSRDRRLVAVLGIGANMVPAGNDLAALGELGVAAAVALERPRMLIGPREEVSAVWETYCRDVRANVRLDTLHTYYELRPDTLNFRLSLPGLQLATMNDLLDVEDASAQMLLDDLGRRDREEDPAIFRRRIRHAISQEEVYVYREEGRLLFKINLGPRTADTVQLQGVFTLGQARNRNLGRRGCAELCRRIFSDGVPLVNLFVREQNLAATRAYEAVGFKATCQFRMIILDFRRP